jgi:hypothetical protein
MAATITFKAKVETMRSMEDDVLYQYVTAPVLTRRHCNMDAWRLHPKFGAYANSDFFPGVLAKIRREHLNGFIRLDRLPEHVTIDTSGFLAVVTLDCANI